MNEKKSAAGWIKPFRDKDPLYYDWVIWYRWRVLGQSWESIGYDFSLSAEQVGEIAKHGDRVTWPEDKERLRSPGMQWNNIEITNQFLIVVLIGVPLIILFLMFIHSCAK